MYEIIQLLPIIVVEMEPLTAPGSMLIVNSTIIEDGAPKIAGLLFVVNPGRPGNHS